MKLHNIPIEDLKNTFLEYLMSTAMSEEEKDIYKTLWNRLPEKYKQYYIDIWQGKRAISATNDYVFKTIFDPDTHKERLSNLLTKVIGIPIKVKHSLRNESNHQSELSKKMIMDIVSELEDGEYSITEMQIIDQDYIDKRAVAYSSDLVLCQYSVENFQPKASMDFSKLKKIYTVIFMVVSPEKFKENPNYLHHFRQVSDTGLKLNLLQEYIFVELESFVNKSDFSDELEALLSLIATNDIIIREKIISEFPQYINIVKDIHSMISNSRKELLGMFTSDLEQLERNSLISQGREEGRKEGRKEGREEGSVRILLKLGYTDAKEISRLTNISIDKVLKIINSDI